MPFSDELIRRARASWQRRSGELLSGDEVKEGLHNLVRFALALREAKRATEMRETTYESPLQQRDVYAAS